MKPHIRSVTGLGSAFAILLLLGAPLCGQPAPGPGKGGLRIHVVTRTGGAVPGAVVMLLAGEKAVAGQPVLKADGNGFVSFSASRTEGPYRVRAWAHGLWGEARVPASWWAIEKPARVIVNPADHPPHPRPDVPGGAGVAPAAPAAPAAR